MISPMTKYSFLIYHKDYEKFLDDLRDFGIAHIIENDSEISDEIREQFQKITSVNKTIRYLERRGVERTEDAEENVGGNGEDVFNEVNQLQSKIETVRQQIAQLRKIHGELDPWGDFDVRKITELAENKKIIIRLFVCQDRKFNTKWTEEHNIFIINKKSGYTYFALVEFDEKMVDLDAEEVSIPEKNPSELAKKINGLINELQNIDNRLDEIAKTDIPGLEFFKKQLIEKIEYDKAIFSTQSEVKDLLKIVEIWCPDEKINDLENYLDTSDVYYIKAASDKNDKAPVLLKNKKFHKDFEVLGEMYSLPKYGELDLTPFFAPFYALFFGFCLGDVGYGMLLAVAAVIMKPKVKKEMKALMNLVVYLGSATVFFGIISGTFFGINLYGTNLPIYSSFQEYFDAKDTNINNILFYLSLILGGVQIIFGLILKAVNETIQFGWKFAVGTMGWATLLLGMTMVYIIGEFSEVNGRVISIAQYTILTVSGLMILFLNNLNRKIYVNFGLGLWNSYNMVTGILGDLLSYIRLFALGIASAILGFVFNSLALSMSGDIPVLSIIIMVIILVLGHSINLFMSGLGAFVHPMRLTFVEFYKNAGFTGGGEKYKPFRKLV